MPWNMKDFPASMKNLDKLTRKKAIDIANALLDEGYPDNRAIPIAIDQAKKWYEDASESEKRTFEKEKIQARRMNTIRILVLENCLIQM
ncbi:hypothetical protein HMPREF1347_02805 [Enterococcus faecium 504]|nr:hypothetical protein HMPREF1347_02805 [Enterococcus faecium 504]